MQQVKRFWPDDAQKNRGDPWFTAVITDYDPERKCAGRGGRGALVLKG